MKVATLEEARQILLDEQVRSGGVPTIPAGGDTIETERGWAFFNANGYLGTVTGGGEVVSEPQFAEAD